MVGETLPSHAAVCTAKQLILVTRLFLQVQKIPERLRLLVSVLVEKNVLKSKHPNTRPRESSGKENTQDVPSAGSLGHRSEKAYTLQILSNALVQRC